MMRRLEQAAFDLCCPGAERARLTVLIFHRVLPTVDPMFSDTPTAQVFDQHLRWLKRWFHFLPLRDAVEQLYRGSLPARTACITFDDGYADNLEIALPLLERHGIPATVFVSTGFLDGGIMWNDAVVEALRLTASEVVDLRHLELGEIKLSDWASRGRAALRLLDLIKHEEPTHRSTIVDAIVHAANVELPRDLMLTTDQLRRLSTAQLIDIGAHTVTHPILARCQPEQARAEIERGRTTLEALLQRPIELFAYPNGKSVRDYTDEHVRMVSELGFRAAVSTNWGVSTSATDRFQMRRFTPWGKDRLRYAGQLLRNARALSEVSG